MQDQNTNNTVIYELQKLQGELSLAKFAYEINVNADTIRNIYRGKCKVSDKLAKQLENYSDIYAQWWRTGEGIKYKLINNKIPRINPLSIDNLFNDFGNKLKELQENAGYTNRKMSQIICKSNEVRYAKLVESIAKPTYEEFFNTFCNFYISADELITNTKFN